MVLILRGLTNKVAIDIKERLDRAAINEAWKSLFPSAILENSIIQGSHHSFLLLDTSLISGFNPRPFKFEWAWTSHLKCKDLIHSVWNNRNNPNCFTKFKIE